MIFPDAKLFRDIALSRSISRGAQLNDVSQSAASQNIQELEKRLGSELLDRSTRPLGLTEAGKMYLDLCQDVVSREHEFFAGLERIRGVSEGVLRVASIYSIGLTEMSRLRQELEALIPMVHLQVEYLRPDKVYEQVLNDQADLGLVSYPDAGRELSVIPWRDEQMAVALYPEHPLAPRETLQVADLDGLKFIAFDEDLIIRKELDRFLEEAQIRVEVVMQFDNIQMVKEAVALAQGVSILPDRTMQAEIDQGRLVSIPLNAPGLARPVGIVHRRRKKLNLAARTFLELLKPQAVEAMLD